MGRRDINNQGARPKEPGTQQTNQRRQQTRSQDSLSEADSGWLDFTIAWIEARLCMPMMDQTGRAPGQRNPRWEEEVAPSILHPAMEDRIREFNKFIMNKNLPGGRPAGGRIFPVMHTKEEIRQQDDCTSPEKKFFDQEKAVFSLSYDDIKILSDSPYKNMMLHFFIEAVEREVTEADRHQKKAILITPEKLGDYLRDNAKRLEELEYKELKNGVDSIVYGIACTYGPLRSKLSHNEKFTVYCLGTTQVNARDPGYNLYAETFNLEDMQKMEDSRAQVRPGQESDEQQAPEENAVPSTELSLKAGAMLDSSNNMVLQAELRIPRPTPAEPRIEFKKGWIKKINDIMETPAERATVDSELETATAEKETMVDSELGI